MNDAKWLQEVINNLESLLNNCKILKKKKSTHNVDPTYPGFIIIWVYMWFFYEMEALT